MTQIVERSWPITPTGIGRKDYSVLQEYSTEPIQYLSRHPSGKPVFVENWDYGRSYSFETSGEGGLEVVTSSDIEAAPAPRKGVLTGKQMGKLLTPGTGAAAAPTAYYVMGMLPNLRLGMEVFFALPYSQADLAAAFDYLSLASFRLEKDVTAPTRLEPIIIYDAALDELALAIGDGEPWPGHTLLSNVFATHYHTSQHFVCWQNLKLIVDLRDGREVCEKLYFNDREFNLATYGAITRVAAVYGHPVLMCAVGARDGGTQASMLLGNTIVTMEEP